MLSTDLQEFLWADRPEPLYSVHPTVTRYTPVAKDPALDRLREGWSYFAPVPRVERGNSREDCTTSFNALYCDVDRHEESTPEEMVSEIEEILVPLDLMPSVIVYSGNRGLHLYWKLSEDIPVDRIEDYNRRLSVILGGDSCFDRTHFFRHPGTVNEKSGRAVEVLEFNATVHPIASLEALGLVGSRGVSRAEPARAAPRSEDSEWYAAAENLGDWHERPSLDLSVLGALQWSYIRQEPEYGWTYHGKSRSVTEQEIVYRLVGKGCGASDIQVKEFADEYLPKHWERWAKDGDAYIETCIRSARRLHHENGWITSPEGG